MIFLPLLLILFAAAGIGYRDAWFSNVDKDPKRDVLWEVTVGFSVAFCASLVYAICFCWFGNKSGFDTASKIDIAKVIIATLIAWPASFIALSTIVGASRVSFIDWGCLPLFAVATAPIVDKEGWEKLWQSWTHGLGTIGSLVFMLGGMLVIVRSLKEDNNPEGWWPPGRPAHISRRIGVIAALVSSCFGYLAIKFANDLLKEPNNMPKEVALPLRLLPLGPLLFVACLMAGKDTFRIDKSQARRASVFALLVIVPLLALYDGLRRGEGALESSHWMATVPLWVFAFELFVFRVRTFASISTAEKAGLSLILFGAVVRELSKDTTRAALAETWHQIVTLLQ